MHALSAPATFADSRSSGSFRSSKAASGSARHSPLTRKRLHAQQICRAQHDSSWVSVEPQHGASKVQAMTEYVETVEPTMITSFTEQVCGIIGMLPPQFFEVNVRSHSTSLEQLLYTHLLHGYMFRSAMIRVDLKSSLALPSAAGNSPSSPQSLLWSAGVQQDGNYAPGTQLSNVNGDVLKWHNDLGAQSVSAQVYIQQLEAEIAHLKQQQAEQTRGLLGQQENVLLNEIQDLGSDAVMLTQDAGDDVHLAFRLFVERQLGTDHRETNPLPECTANELALLLFYTMAVGYTLCSMHVSHGIASSLDVADCTDDDDDF